MWRGFRGPLDAFCAALFWVWMLYVVVVLVVVCSGIRDGNGVCDAFRVTIMCGVLSGGRVFLACRHVFFDP